jgi:hypothetical protein
VVQVRGRVQLFYRIQKSTTTTNIGQKCSRPRRHKLKVRKERNHKANFNIKIVRVICNQRLPLSFCLGAAGEVQHGLNDSGAGIYKGGADKSFFAGDNSLSSRT